MSKGVGKKVAIGVAVALLTALALLLLTTTLVVRGAVGMEEVPLWLLRAAGPAIGCLVVISRKQRKRKKRKRR